MIKTIITLLFVGVIVFLAPRVEAALLVTQPNVSSGDYWDLDYNNGQVFEFDMNYTGQWPVLTCKYTTGVNVAVWFQSNEVYIKTAGGLNQFLGGIYSPATQHYKVICDNDTISVYVNGGLLGSVTDNTINVPSTQFLNHPRFDFVANGYTQLTNLRISDVEIPTPTPTSTPLPTSTPTLTPTSTPTPTVWPTQTPTGIPTPTSTPASYPSNKEQCKQSGWETFTTPKFKNQGDCVSFINRQK